MHLFGKKKAQPKVEPKDAIQMLKEKEDMLTKRRDLLEKRASEELQKVKEIKMKPGNEERKKKDALMCMKRKKMLTDGADQLDRMIMNIGMQVMKLEEATLNVEAFKSMEAFTEGMKNIQKEMPMEKIDEITLDMHEQLDTAKEISDALSTPVMANDFDDDELLAELDEVWQDQMNESAAELPATAATILELPAVPSGEPKLAIPPTMTQEELELAELERAMAAGN